MTEERKMTWEELATENAEQRVVLNRIAALAEKHGWVNDGTKLLSEFVGELMDEGSLRDYCRECPECGAVSELGAHAPMDEDGCCSTCGADSSVAGALTYLKEELETLKSKA